MRNRGSAPILILLAAVGLIFFLLVANSFEFKDKLFNLLFPKPPSFAAEPDEILVSFKKEVPEEDRQVIRSALSLQTEEVVQSKDEEEVIERATSIGRPNLGQRRVSKKKFEFEVVRVAPGQRDRIIEELRKNPDVKNAEPNYIGEADDLTPVIPGDPAFRGQWNLRQVQAPLAWAMSKGNSEIFVAQIDSGIKTDHEDLIGKNIEGKNFLDNNNNIFDSAGHGTSVGGIIVELTDNGIGGASLGWNTKVMPLKIVTNNNTYSYANLIKAIIYAADNRARVINCSLSGSSDSTELREAVDYATNTKGAVVVAAMGNLGSATPRYPAAIGDVIAVGSTNINDQKSVFSNTGDHIDVVAPGEAIYSTTKEGGYSTFNGTSLSTPHVSALAALILAIRPNLSPSEVTRIIRENADHLGTDGCNDQYGCGRINAARALAFVTGEVLPTPSPTPTPRPTSSPTPTPTPVASLTISSVSFSTTRNSATITWDTNINSTSEVRYDTDNIDNLKYSKTGDPAINHRVVITELSRSTNYYYRVISRIPGSKVQSTIQQFRTQD